MESVRKNKHMREFVLAGVALAPARKCYKQVLALNIFSTQMTLVKVSRGVEVVPAVLSNTHMLKKGELLNVSLIRCNPTHTKLSSNTKNTA